MKKIKKLVELSKVSIEDIFLNYDFGSDCQFLPKDAEGAIFELGSEWYFEMLLQAGYGASTIDIKIDKMDFGELASALDDWYKTEMYPKVFNNYDYQEAYRKHTIRYCGGM